MTLEYAIIRIKELENELSALKAENEMLRNRNCKFRSIGAHFPK